MWKNFRLQTPEGDGGGGGGGDWRASFGAEAAPILKDYAQPTDFLKAHTALSTELTTLKSAPAPSWYSDANKDFVANKGFKTGDDAITSLRNLETLFGADKAGRTIVLPKDDKDVEGIKAMRSKLGVPESPDKYELPVPEGDAGEFAKTAATWLHEAGIPKSAGQAIAARWNEHVKHMVAEGEKAVQAEATKQLDGLKTEWGDQFPAKSEAARRFMTQVGFTAEETKLYEQAFGTANMLKRWAAIGEKLGEHGFAGGGDGGGNGSVTPAQARKQLDEAKLARLDNKMTEGDYQKLMDTLGPIAAKAA